MFGIVLGIVKRQEDNTVFIFQDSAIELLKMKCTHLVGSEDV